MSFVEQEKEDHKLLGPQNFASPTYEKAGEAPADDDEIRAGITCACSRMQPHKSYPATEWTHGRKKCVHIATGINVELSPFQVKSRNVTITESTYTILIDFTYDGEGDGLTVRRFTLHKNFELIETLERFCVLWLMEN